MYNQHLSYIINDFVTLLLICSPLSALPALLGLTLGRSDKEKRRTGIVASAAMGLILLIVTWIGSPLLTFLGISVPSFQIAGGIVIFTLAMSMLNAQQSRMKQAEEDLSESERKPSVAIVPLAIPLMAGPGAMSTVIVLVNESPGVMNQLTVSASAILVAATLAVVLYFAGSLERVLGHTGINIINRIGGLVLAAKAVGSIYAGVIGLFPFLAH
jgi:multiple antibiotic resistance protein